jgi:hypothetical protein
MPNARSVIRPKSDQSTEGACGRTSTPDPHFQSPLPQKILGAYHRAPQAVVPFRGPKSLMRSDVPAQANIRRKYKVKLSQYTPNRFSRKTLCFSATCGKVSFDTGVGGGSITGKLSHDGRQAGSKGVGCSGPGGFESHRWGRCLPWTGLDQPRTNRFLGRAVLHRARECKRPSRRDLSSLSEPIRPQIQTRLDGGVVCLGEEHEALLR